MSQAPYVPEDERAAFRTWLAAITATPSVRVIQLLRAAYEYAAERTGLSVEEVERSMAALGGDSPTEDAVRWVEYVLNEYRKTGAYPESPRGGE